jgi:signal peptidase I
VRGFLKFLAWTVAVLGAVFLVLYLTLFDFWTVPSDDPRMSASIQPMLAAGDVLVVMRHGSPDRGDLLRCSDPQAPGRFVIAREEGRGGEKIDLVEEAPSIDGTRTPSPAACDPPEMTMKDPDTGEEVELLCSMEELGSVSYKALRAKARREAPTSFRVEKGRIYVVSDNRHIHVDSRDYGTVDPDTCKHLVFRLWSKDGFGDREHRFNFLL